MNMRLGNKDIEFRKGFKPKSLSEFSKVFKPITGATEKELKSAFKKLGGDVSKSTKSTGKVSKSKGASTSD